MSYITISLKSEQAVRIALRTLVALLISAIGFGLLGATSAFFLAFLPLLIAVFFIEQYYASPATVLANAFALLLLFLAERETFMGGYLEFTWWAFIIALVLLLTLSLALKAFQNEERKSLLILGSVVGEIGSARFLYGIVFLLFIGVTGTISSAVIIALGVVFLLALYSKVINSIINKVAQFAIIGTPKSDVLGRITSLEGGTAVRLRLNEYKNPGDLIEIEDRQGARRKFVLVDVLVVENEIVAEGVPTDARPIVLANSRTVFDSTQTRDENIIGRVKQGSNINKIIFEPLSLDSYHLEHGDTISIQISDHEGNQRKVLYQITNAVAREEDMDSGISRRSIDVYAE
ncbi:MAG: hypothetical protein Q7S47_00990, partial [bacterium]|nr:hypothetical protein [bacterium]